jgi:hypothetical protein
MTDDPRENQAPDQAGARQRSGLSALLVGAVLVFTMVAPPDWKVYAPLLFLIPLLANVVTRRRRRNAGQTQPDCGTIPHPSPDPYSHSPKDPKDPRRYKPIG